MTAAGRPPRRAAGHRPARVPRAVVTDLPSIDEALALVLGRVRPLGDEEVAVAAADGRVLAAPALATVDLPPFPSSAMDGFAVRAADTPGTLAVVGSSAAGRPSGLALGAGEAIAISTGAVVPDGADAVVPIEDVEDRRLDRRPSRCQLTTVRTSARAAATSRPGTRSSARACGSARPSSARSRPPGSPSCAVRGVRASRCS